MPTTAADTPTTLVGDTFVRDYDQGIVDKLGGILHGANWFADVPNVIAPPYPDDWPDEALRRTQMPGVPITLAGPNEAIAQWVNPSIIVRRMDPQLAMERWSEAKVKYVRPAPGATPVTVQGPKGFNTPGRKYRSLTATGYTKYETKRWPYPYDLMYTILARAEGELADMGGSGDAHEINWGDVTDVVREAVSQAFDHTVQECLSKMDMDQVDEAHRSLKDMQEYKEAQEIGDELAGKISELLRRAHEEGMLIMAGAGTR